MKLQFGCAAGVVLIWAAACLFAGAAGEPAGSQPWAAPKVMAARKVSDVTGAQVASNLFSNIDCTVITYRLVASNNMQSGCFTETAFGMLDNDSDVAIFDGTDEGVQLTTYLARQILVAWPKAGNLVTLTPVSTGGTLIGLYKNPLAELRDERNLTGQLTDKTLVAPPELSLKAPDGSPLVINPETLTFSDNGSWLVAETLNGSFVRVNLASLTAVAFAPAYGSEGSPALLKSRVAISEDGRFIAIANDVATALKVYDLEACDGIANNLVPQHCGVYDYWPFLAQQTGGNKSIRRVRFITEGLLSIEAIAANPANDGVYELAPAGSISALTAYIGLGDSYTSGEGAFDYLDGTDEADNMCHVSRNAYPLLLTHDLFSAAGGHTVACSGAVINDVGSTSGTYRGQVRGVASLEQLEQSQPLLLESVEANFIPGYIAQQRFVKRWQPLVATVSVGGDDIGFGDMVENCVEPHLASHLADNTCYSAYEDRLEVMQSIDRTVPHWTALYSQLKREAPAMRLYTIGYPQVVSDAGSCALNVHLNRNELEFAESVVDYLNQAIRKASAAAGIEYIDISQALKGHRLCEAASYNVAVNGLTAGTDAGPFGTKLFGKESYHPNALGQFLMEQAILQQTHNLLAGNSEDTGSGNAASASTLLNAPRTGRKVYVKIPDKSMTAGIGRRGLPMAVQAAGTIDGLRASASYTIHLDGPGGKTLGVLSSDNGGNINGTVTIPADSPPGGHTLDLVGENQDGEPTDVSQPIYIPASDADSDGDGVEDISDSCPGAFNSDQDADRDGIDDTCDAVIGTTHPPEPSSNNMPSGNVAFSHPSLLISSREGQQTKSGSRKGGHAAGTTTRAAKTAREISSVPYTPLKTLRWWLWPILAVFLWLAVLLAREIPKKLTFNYNR